LPFLEKGFIFLRKYCKVSLEQFLTRPRFGKERGVSRLPQLIGAHSSARTASKSARYGCRRFIGAHQSYVQD